MTEFEMHNMNEIGNKPASQTAESGRLYIEGLLEKYPAITDRETSEILDFLTKAPAIDAALLSCNDAIKENLKAFRYDNSKQLGFTLQGWLSLSGVLGLLALAIYFLWDSGM